MISSDNNDDVDIYESFDKLNCRMDTENFSDDTAFQQVVKNTSNGRKAPLLGRSLNTSNIRGPNYVPIARVPTAANLRLATASDLGAEMVADQ
ncbi:unnamed protein product [Heterobilharzia americana]|nr:unnamed protein product [Heterobilharzia americana]